MTAIGTKVKGYSDKQLLDRVKSLPSYKYIPNEYWILGVQSQEDTYNKFDDKFYLFKGEEFILVTSGTTNSGATGLKNFTKFHLKGTAVIKTDEWYYGLWKYGIHKGRMLALKQVSPIKYYRDWNRNKKVEEMGKLYEGFIGIDFHTDTYRSDLSIFKRFINGWSLGCQVVNNIEDYYNILYRVREQRRVDYCLIKEF